MNTMNSLDDLDDLEPDEIKIEGISIFVSLFGCVASVFFIIYFCDMIKNAWAAVYAFAVQIITSLGVLFYCNAMRNEAARDMDHGDEEEIIKNGAKVFGYSSKMSITLFIYLPIQIYCLVIANKLK